MQYGCMGRDVAAAEKFAQHGHEVYPVGPHPNPSLIAVAENSGGKFYQVEDAMDQKVLGECLEDSGAEMFYTNSDDALAAGIVDMVRGQNPDLLIPSPDKEASKIEWDKFYSRDIVERIHEKYNPLYVPVENEKALQEAIEIFWDDEKEVVVKPRGLTGGKGVKVMGPHLKDYVDVSLYAKEILADPNQQGLILEEKIQGREFTVQAYTDGRTLIVPPTTYDYPYRQDGDTGPGTGGMGCFTMPAGENLPFLTNRNRKEAVEVMQQALVHLEDDWQEFKGTLYGSFFKTEKGLKVVEFNARIGDPEGISIVDLLEDDVDLAEVLEKIATGDLEEKDVRFRKMASTVIYLVSPGYAYRSDSTYGFDVDAEAIADNDCRLYHVASRQVGENQFKTVGSSRTLAVSALAETPWEARDKILDAIDEGVGGPLEFRQDIGSKEYIANLA